MRRKLILILMLFISLLFPGCKPSQTDPPIESFPDYFYNPFGYASLSISKRQDSFDYTQVNNEVEFLDALLEEDNKIIEICSDLNLGSKEVEAKLKETNKSLDDYRNVYRVQSRQALLHPVLIESGVGRVRIRKRDNLMIFSKTGVEIKHATFEIDGCQDIVIRNLKFSELWEWDEDGQGQYKRNDWDYFVVEKSKGIWFDHLTFNQAYDGIIDVKEDTSNLTLSFSKLDFTANDFISTQIATLEQNQASYPYYQSLREKGISADEIVEMASYQKKGFNLGNTTDGEGFEEITFTFHHLEISNLQDRMPRIRKGDAHLYQIILDNTGINDLNLILNSKGVSLVNQGIIPTEDGAVLMENCIFKNVSVLIKSHQDSSNDSKYTGKYKVVDSAYYRNDREHFGSSESSPPVWYQGNSHPRLPFVFRNYQELPYQYKLLDIAFLPEFFREYPVGHQNLKDFNWLEINNKLHLKENK